MLYSEYHYKKYCTIFGHLLTRNITDQLGEYWTGDGIVGVHCKLCGTYVLADAKEPEGIADLKARVQESISNENTLRIVW